MLSGLAMATTLQATDSEWKLLMAASDVDAEAEEGETFGEGMAVAVVLVRDEATAEAWGAASLAALNSASSSAGFQSRPHGKTSRITCARQERLPTPRCSVTAAGPLALWISPAGRT